MEGENNPIIRIKDIHIKAIAEVITMYRIKAVIQQRGSMWILAFNAIDDKGNGKGKKINNLLPYIHTFKDRKEAYENLKVILNNRCKCIIDLTGKKFERIGEETGGGIDFYEWKEVKNT